MSKSTLLGYKRFTSKKGIPFCVADVATVYNNKDIADGAVGSKAEQIFLPDDQLDYLQPSDIGKEVRMSYTISRGRAYLDMFEVVRK